MNSETLVKGYASMGELTRGLTEYFACYNGERPHQSLSNRTPDEVYTTAEGGGAKIVDRFSKKASESQTNEVSGQRRAAAIEVDSVT